MTTQVIITLAIALVSLALGIYNAWFARRDKLERLRVIPKYSIGHQFEGISIDVVNTGTVPVTLTEVGLLLQKSRNPLPRRISFPMASSAIGSSLPFRLDRGECFSTILAFENIPDSEYVMGYALTATDRMVTGTSPALKQWLPRSTAPRL